MARGEGYENDLVKYAEAITRGWTVLPVSPRMIQTGAAVRYLAQLLQTHSLIVIVRAQA